MNGDFSVVKLASRIKLAEMFAKRGFKVGVEVGVYSGEFSKIILLSNPRLFCLYSIDRWRNNSGRFARRLYHMAAANLKGFGARSKIVVGDSVASASQFPDGTLDFVYIDADHLYESAMKDLVAWWPKIKLGGILSGHDYKNRGKASSRGLCPCGTSLKNMQNGALSACGVCGVRRAVDEFVTKFGLALQTTGEKPSSFWIVKP